MSLPVPLQDLIAAATASVSTVHKTVHHPTAPPLLTDHSVGSGVLTLSGKIYTGINIFHFVGGPCAESVALGNALQNGEDGEEFTHIVAVGNRGRGVISPCGRCRQMLIDYYPGIKVLVRDRDVEDKEGEVVRVVGIGELLPYAYISKRERIAMPK